MAGSGKMYRFRYSLYVIEELAPQAGLKPTNPRSVFGQCRRSDLLAVADYQ
jgi:hypothetical protein